MIDLSAGEDVAACVGISEGATFILTAPRARPGAGRRGVKVSFDDQPDWVHGSCLVRGFFINEPAAISRDGWRTAHLRGLNKIEIMTSGRFCVAGAASTTHPRRIARLGPVSVIRPIPGAVLPTCRKHGEKRSEIPVWAPRLARNDDIRSEPPQGDGKLVFMSIVGNIDCPGVWQDRFYSLEHPNPKVEDFDAGGFSVELRGNVRSENGHCIWSGLFMNDAIGFNMGWATAAFIAIDESAAAASGQFCLARRHGPLHRPTQAK